MEPQTTISVFSNDPKSIYVIYIQRSLIGLLTTLSYTFEIKINYRLSMVIYLTCNEGTTMLRNQRMLQWIITLIFYVMKASNFGERFNCMFHQVHGRNWFH